jgi:membrane protease subunit (stomatin/prohibitin family)
MGGWAKAFWVIFVIVLPFLGILVYLIARGHKMQEHAIQDAQAQKQAFDAHVREVTNTSSVDQLAKLAELKDQGVLTASEFEAQKAKLLS